MAVFTNRYNNNNISFLKDFFLKCIYIIKHEGLPMFYETIRNMALYKSYIEKLYKYL